MACHVVKNGSDTWHCGCCAAPEQSRVTLPVTCSGRCRTRTCLAVYVVIKWLIHHLLVGFCRSDHVELTCRVSLLMRHHDGGETINLKSNTMRKKSIRISSECSLLHRGSRGLSIRLRMGYLLPNVRLSRSSREVRPQWLCRAADTRLRCSCRGRL